MEKKVVSGIAIRRRIGGIEKEILLAKRGEKWEFPNVRIEDGTEGRKELATYMSETLGMGKIGINDLYGNGRNSVETKKTIEAYLVTVYGRKNDPINGENLVGWFSKAEIKGKPVSKTTLGIIGSLMRNSYF